MPTALAPLVLWSLRSPWTRGGAGLLLGSVALPFDLRMDQQASRGCTPRPPPRAPRDACPGPGGREPHAPRPVPRGAAVGACAGQSRGRQPPTVRGPFTPLAFLLS